MILFEDVDELDDMAEKWRRSSDGRCGVQTKRPADGLFGKEGRNCTTRRVVQRQRRRRKHRQKGRGRRREDCKVANTFVDYNGGVN